MKRVLSSTFQASHAEHPADERCEIHKHTGSRSEGQIIYYYYSDNKDTRHQSGGLTLASATFSL